MALPLMRPVESRCGPAQRSVNSPLRVERNVRVNRKIVDELDLVGLVLLFHILDGFLRGSSKRSSFSFSLQILRISASSSSMISGVKANGASKS